MNLDIFKSPDTSGKLFKEKYLIKNYNTEYNYIIQYSIMNHLDKLPFKEKVYLCINNLLSPPICKNSNCNNTTKYKNSTIGYYNYCSNACISTDEHIKKLKEEKSYSKFGTKTPFQSDIIKSKIAQTNIAKYGGTSPMCCETVKIKSQQTLLKNYGVTNPSLNKELLNKRIISFKNGNYKYNFKVTSINKYGVNHPWMIKNIHSKTIDVFYIKYKSRILDKIKNTNYNFINFTHNPTTLIFKCNVCYNNFHINPSQFYYRATTTPNQLCTNCFPIAENSSLKQLDLLKFVKENYYGIIIENAKHIINSYEIDIYLPEIKLGIEFNGLYWHSNLFKPKDYHLNKHNTALANDIDLIMIWEDDWDFKQNICKNIILNKINNKPTSYIKEMNQILTKSFLHENHLNSIGIGNINIGIYTNNILNGVVSLYKEDNDLIISRYVNINMESLLYLYQNYTFNNITLISDNSLSDDKLLFHLGFKIVTNIPPIIKNNQRNTYSKSSDYFVFNTGYKQWKLNHFNYSIIY